MKFRKKPVVIDATQWKGDNFDVVIGLLFRNTVTGARNGFRRMDGDDRLYISTLEGEMTAQIGDWIIRGVKGECYPCKPDIFAATYEPVDGWQPSDPVWPPSETTP